MVVLVKCCSKSVKLSLYYSTLLVPRYMLSKNGGTSKVITLLQHFTCTALQAQRKWWAISTCRHVVALQIRRGPRALGWYKVLDAQGEEHSQKSVHCVLYRGNTLAY
jgi:hypothetical protein